MKRPLSNPETCEPAMSAEHSILGAQKHFRNNAGWLIALEIFMAVWAADVFWLRWTTFASELVPESVVFALGFSLWLSAGLLLISDYFGRLVKRPVLLAALLGALGLVIVSLSLAALAVWLIILYFHHWRLCWYLLTEEAVSLNIFGGGES
jgi:hypothetical protein